MATLLAENETHQLVRLNPDELTHWRERNRRYHAAEDLRIRQEGWDRIKNGQKDWPIIIGYMLGDRFIPWEQSFGMLHPGEPVTIPAEQWLQENPRPT